MKQLNQRNKQFLSLVLSVALVFTMLPFGMLEASAAGGYSVTYDSAGAESGSVPVDSGVYEQDGTVTVLDNTGNLARPGYIFGGWMTEDTVYQPGDTFSIAQSTVLSAAWIPVYTVTYDANGGTVSAGGSLPTDTNEYPEGAAVTVQSGDQLTSTYGFKCWNTKADGSGTNYTAGGTLTIDTGDVTLYAIYNTGVAIIQLTNSLTYSANGAVSGTAPSSVDFSETSLTLTVPGNIGSLFKTGYQFAGWNTKSDGSGTTYQEGDTITVSDSQTLYALWKTVYTVTYQPNGGTLWSDADNTEDCAAGASIRLPGYLKMINPPSLGWDAFIGWNTASDGSGTAYMPGDVIAPSSNLTLYARWKSFSDTIGKYGITYDGNGNDGGSLPAISYVSSGTAVTVAAQGTITRSDYQFEGWSDEHGLLYSPGTSVAVSKDLVLYARWLPTYTVTYNVSGTSLTVPTDDTAYVTGENVTVLGTLGTEALVDSSLFYWAYLTGWSTAPNGGGAVYAPGDSFAITGNTTLYAVYSASNPVIPISELCTVTYSSYGATGGTAPVDSNYYSAGDTVTILGSGSLTGSGNFSGWQRGDGSGQTYSAGDTFTFPEGVTNLVLFPTFKTSGGTTSSMAWYIHYNGNGAEAGSVPSDETNYLTSDKSTAYGTVKGNTGGLVRSGYVFAGWSFSSDGSGTVYQAGDIIAFYGNVYFYAVWQTWTRSHAVTQSENGTVTNTRTISEAADVTVLSPTYSTVVYSTSSGDVTKYFSHWNTESDDTGTSYAPGDHFTMLTEDVTLYAIYDTTPVHFVSYNSGNSVGGQWNNVGSGYNAGETATAVYQGTLTGPDGTYFSGWNTESDGSGTLYRAGDTFAMGSSDITLYATWVQYNDRYTVTYNGDGYNSGTLPDSITTYFGSTITLPTLNSYQSSTSAVTLQKNGYILYGWYADGTFYKPGSSFTMPYYSVTVKAAWQPLTYPRTVNVSYSGNGSTGGTAPASSDVSTGFTLTLPENTGGLTRTGYVFSGWSDGNAVYQPGATYSSNRLDDVTFSAVWKQAYTVTYSAGGSSGGTVPTDDTSYTQGETVVLAGNSGGLTQTDALFAGWCVSGQIYHAGDTLTIGTASVTATAVWALLPATEYSVTVHTDGNGTASASAGTAYAGTEITLTATASDGYSFKEWQAVSPASLTITGNTFIMPDEAVTVKAVFEQDTASSHGIILSQTEPYSFASQTVGYSSVTPLTVTATNTGNQTTGELTVALSGSNADSFILSKTTISSIAAGDTESFTVKPSDSLSAGIYTATVTVSGDYITAQTFTVSFTVNTASASSAELSPDTGDFDIYSPGDVATTITWNSATKVTGIYNGEAVLASDYYEVNDTTLTIKQAYLETQAEGSVELTVAFDQGGSATLTVAITDTTPPSLSPATVVYDLNAPGDVSITITWNSASLISDVAYRISPDTTLYTLDPDDYSVSGNVLTINGSFFSTLSLTEGDTFDFGITFDTGAAADLTVEIEDNYTLSNDATLEYIMVNGSDYTYASDTYTCNIILPYGTQPGSASATVNAVANDEKASVSIEQAAVLPGNATIDVTAEDGTALHYTVSFTLDDAPGVAPVVATTTLPGGTVNTAYSQTVTATGDTPITWSCNGTLPNGLDLTTTTGVISGTPTATGTFSFTVTAINSTGSDSQALSITINAASLPELSTPSGLAWDGSVPGKATWTAVSNVTSYTVQLYKGGTAQGSAVTGITATEYNFTSAIASAGTGSYTFKVTAIGDGTHYTNSAISDASAAYSYSDPTPTTYGITVQNNGHGTGSATSISAEAGAIITLTATPNSGYHFKEWQVVSPTSLAITDDTFTMPSEAVTVKAIFEADAAAVDISITQSPVKSILHAITFGLFFDNTIDVSISSTGEIADHYEYQKVADGDTFDAGGTWTQGASFSISPDFKGYVYARAVLSGGTTSDYTYKALVVDTTKPEIRADYDASSGSVAVSVTDSGAGIDIVTYQVGSDAVQTITLTPSETQDITTQHNFTMSGLPDGQYDVVINAADNSGNAADTKTISVDQSATVIDATISPAARSYDLASPSDAKTNIIWNSASSVTGVVYDANSASLTDSSDYTVTGSALTIKSDYLQTLNLSDGDSAEFIISFDTGNPVTFTVDFVDSYTPSGNADLSDLTVDGTTVTGFNPDTTDYDVELPYGTATATVGAAADDPHATLDITQAGSLPGTATVEVTAEDMTSSKEYEIHFTLASPIPTTHSITVQNDGHGTGSADPSSAAAGQTVTLSGSANSGYHFTQWQVIAPAGMSITGNIFTMPDEAVTVKAIFGRNSSSSGGSSGSSSGNTAAAPTTAPENQPNQPVTAAVSITAVADSNGSSSASIPDKAVTDAIAKAQADAKSQGKTANGISVALNITVPAGNTVLSATLSQTALKALVDAGVTGMEIGGLPVSVSFDQTALRAVQSQSSGNITITAAVKENLSNDAQTMIGTRPVYNITVGYTANGSSATVTDLGGGIATVSIPYTPAQGEAAGYLYGVYVDGNGNAARIDGSAYDANSGCLIFTTNHLSIYGVGYTAPSAKFTDISSHWAKDSIDYAVGRGLLTGTTDTTFAPDTVMTRGMLVTALGRLAGADVSGYTTSSFSDVATDKYYMPYVEWAYRQGIVSGIGNGKFDSERAVTREEIALILQNYANATGYTLPVTREADTYADASSISTPYAAAVTAMQQAGVIMGGSSDMFSPKSSATRAEVSAMLTRYIKLTIDPDTAQGWAKNDAGQYLYYKDGKALTGEQTIDGVRYYFTSEGVLQTGWVQDDSGSWYYYSGNTMQVGWWEIGTNGSGKTYYFTSDGSMISGKWYEIDGQWYYFYTDGSLAKSTTVDGYELDENGVRTSD